LTSSQFFVKKEDIHLPHAFLRGVEHHHLKMVLRIKAGEKIELFDEEGRRYSAVVGRSEIDRTVLEIEEVREEKRSRILITLAQSLIKAQAMDFVVQKATELGASAVIPVEARRSVARIEGKVDKKLERWRRIALEAAKQCKITFPPDILPPLTLERLAQERRDGVKLLLSENQGRMMRDILVGDGSGTFPGARIVPAPSPPSVLIVVGPEGGWESEEEAFLLASGFEAVSLGKNILRAETAALAGLAMISHFWNA